MRRQDGVWYKARDALHLKQDGLDAEQRLR